MGLDRERSVDSGNSLRLHLLLPEKGKDTLAALLAQKSREAYRVGELLKTVKECWGLVFCPPHPPPPLLLLLLSHLSRVRLCVTP